MEAAYIQNSPGKACKGQKLSMCPGHQARSGDCAGLLCDLSFRHRDSAGSPGLSTAPGRIRKTEQECSASADRTHDLRQVQLRGFTGQAHGQAQLPNWPSVQAHLLLQRGHVA